MSNENECQLDSDTTNFIRQKVRELGSVKAVDGFYRGDCPVDNYARHIAKEIYTNNDLSIRQFTAQPISTKYSSSISLTDEQQTVVTCLDKRILTIAGAGSGKTRTLIAKAVHLLNAKIAASNEVLLLAFAKNAQEELQERITKLYKHEFTTRTFHSLGLKIIGKATGKIPSVSKMCEDEKIMTDNLIRFVMDMLRNKQERQKAYDFLLLLYKENARLLPETEKHLNKTLANIPIIGEIYKIIMSQNPNKAKELTSNIQLKGIRTIDGKKVKSFGEKVIADTLYLNSINYLYEQNYEYKTYDEDHRQYKPDFYLPDHKIYIEYFGVDEYGQTRPDINQEKYKKSMEWKRELHKKHGTTLIEVTSSKPPNKDIFNELVYNLSANRVPVTEDKIVKDLVVKTFDISACIDILSKFIPLFKSYAIGRLTVSGLQNAEHFSQDGYSSLGKNEVWNELIRRANINRESRTKTFLPFARSIVEKYEDELRKNKEVDFSDMIGWASLLVQKGRYNSSFKHILVDEFQDISQSRFHLLKSLINTRPDTSLFCVGDDWQSIYRFTGSDVSLMVNFKQHFDNVTELQVNKTFRFPQNIAEASSMFIQENDKQIKKKINSVNKGPAKPHITVVESYNPSNAVDEIVEILKQIRKSDKNTSLSVYLLARYNWDLPNEQQIKNIKNNCSGFNIKAATIHKAKGGEADYVIILNVHGGRHGMPCDINDDPILTLMLTDDPGIPYAEERRIFYVALTRAKKEVYIIADQSDKGVFIEELAKDEYRKWVEFKSSVLIPNRCPSCNGFLLKKKGYDGNHFYGCSNYQNGCQQTTLAVCPECNNGPIIDKHCTKCNAKISTCPRCNKGLLLKVNIEGRQVYACQAWYWKNKCNYVDEYCPNCGRPLVRKTGQHGDFISCLGWNQGCTWKAKKSKKC